MTTHDQDATDCETVTVTFHVDVYFWREIDRSYGADADGRRGVEQQTDHITSMDIHEDVPDEVAGYLRAVAASQFLRRHISPHTRGGCVRFHLQ